MGIFNKKPSAKKMAMEFSNSICQYAAFGLNRVRAISMVFESNLTQKQFIEIYLEFVIYQIHIVDKMASKLYGSNFRSEFVNSIVDNEKSTFLEIQGFRGFCDDMNYFFEKYFHDTFYIYPFAGSILGNDSTQVTKFLTKRLCCITIDKENDTINKLAESMIYEMLETFTKEILSKKPMKTLV